MYKGIFGGMFDFDHDGKLNSWEKACEIGFLVKLDEEEEEAKKRKKDNLKKDNLSYCSHIHHNYDAQKPDNTWQENCEDGSEYGLFPTNFETQKMYEDALEEAKYGWRNIVEADYELDVSPEDYETLEEFEEALELENAIQNSFLFKR